MDVNRLYKTGYAANIMLVAVNAFAFIVYRIENTALKNVSEIPAGIYVLELLLRLLVIGVGAAALVMCIICMVKNQGRLKGFGLLLPAAIVTIVFGIIGIMLGIAIWILCGVSMTKLKKSLPDAQAAEINSYNYANGNGNYYGDSQMNGGYTTDPYANGQMNGGYTTDPFANGSATPGYMQDPYANTNPNDEYSDTYTGNPQ